MSAGETWERMDLVGTTSGKDAKFTNAQSTCSIRATP